PVRAASPPPLMLPTCAIPTATRSAPTASRTANKSGVTGVPASGTLVCAQDAKKAEGADPSAFFITASSLLLHCCIGYRCTKPQSKGRGAGVSGPEGGNCGSANEG